MWSIPCATRTTSLPASWTRRAARRSSSSACARSTATRALRCRTGCSTRACGRSRKAVLSTPPSPGLARTLALAWVHRGRTGKALLGLLVTAVIGWSAYQVGVVRPAQQRTEQARAQTQREQRELTDLLPRALEQGHQEGFAEARRAPARPRADDILRDARSALARRDAAGAKKAISDLDELRADLRREYGLRIISRPGEQSGVWRVPARNPSARNCYIVVEPVASDGRVLGLPVTSEETGQTQTVSKWAVR